MRLGGTERGRENREKNSNYLAGNSRKEKKRAEGHSAENIFQKNNGNNFVRNRCMFLTRLIELPSLLFFSISGGGEAARWKFPF